MKFKSIILLLLLSVFGHLFAQSNVKLEKLTSFGGTLKNVAVKNNNIFISTTDGLKIFDATNKNSIQPVSYINNIGISLKMDIVGDRVYLTNTPNGLVIINISNIAKPFIEGKTNFLQNNAVDDKTEANDVKIKDNYAYMTVGKKGLAVVDVNSPSKPKILNYFQLSGYTVGIDIQDSYAYVVSAFDGLDIIDISNPNKLISVSHLDLGGHCNNIKVVGGYAYIANTNGLEIIDISNPNAPVLIETFDTNGYCLALDIKDNYVYIANDRDIKVIDITNRRSPTLVDSMSKSNLNCYDIKINENHAFVINNDKPCVIDISDPYNLKEVSSFDIVSSVKKIKIVNDKIYVANDYNGIQIADISDIDNIKLLGEYHTGGIANDIDLKNSTLFVANNHKGLLLLDVSDPKNPSLISSINTNGIAKSIVLEDCCAFIANGSAGLSIVNVENEANPVIKGTLDTDGEANDVIVEGNYAFIADGYNGLVIADVSNRSNPQKVSQIKLKDFAYSIKINGNYVYVADGDGGFSIVDISNINSPNLIGNIDTDGQVRDILLWNNFAFVSDDDKGIKIIDVTDPKNMKIVESVSVNNESLQTFIYNNKVFLANYSNGISVFKIIQLPKSILSLNIKNIKRNQVTLTWSLPAQSDIEPIETIKIFRDGTLIKTLDKNVKSFTDANLQSDTLYTYEVKTSNIAGDSEGKQINVRTLKNIPTLPTSLSAKNITENSVELFWIDNSDNESGFKIFRNSKLIKTTKADVTDFNDSNLDSGVSYTYEVKAFNESGDSPSDVVTITTLQSVPADPSGLKASEIKSNMITLIWKDNSDNEDGFRVERNGTVIGYLSKNMTSFTDRTVEAETTYKYSIKAINKAGESKEVSIEVKTSNTIPMPPTSLEAIIFDDNTIKLVWNDNSDNEEGFELYKDDKLLTTTAKDINFYLDKDVKPDILYTYLVQAVNSAGKSIADKVKVKITKLPPIPPTDFNAMALSESEISLSWSDNSNNEEGFEIYRNDTLIYKVKANETSYIDKGLSANTLYKYSIKAINSAGASIQNFAEAKTFDIDKEVPNPPVDFKIDSLSSKVVKLEWKDNSDNERGYKIYRDGELIATLDNQHTSFIDKDLSPDTLYKYEIVAINSKGDSKPITAQVKTDKFPIQKPSSPSNFKAVSNGDRAVELRWDDNSDNEEGFEIYRDGKLIHTALPDEKVFLDSDLIPGTLYKYEIRAINDIGSSEVVKTQVITLDRNTMLIPPTNLFGQVQNDKYIILTWSDNSNNEDGFKIFRDNKLIYTTKANATQYVDIELEPNRVYTYKVKATNKDGDSISDSVKISIRVKIPPTPPIPPTDFSATALSENEIFLSWSDNSDNEEGFEIYRDGTLVYKAKADETSYTDKELKPNTLYKYTIRAVNKQDASIFVSAKTMTFDIDKEVPNPPADFKVSPLSSKVVKLEWKDNSDNERGYKIYRDGKLIATLDNQHTSFIDKDLKPNTNYKYEIVAINSKGASKPVLAKVKTKKDPLSKPNAPSNFTAIANGDKKIELRWSDNSDNEEGFEIYRDGKLIYTALPDEKIFLDTHLIPGTLYKYEIKAVNDIGSSVSVNTQATTLDRDTMIIPPTNLFGEVQNDKYIILTWSDNSDNEEGFKIYRDNKLIYTTKADETQYVDINVEENRYYTYMVKATNKDGDSIGDSIKVSIYVKMIQTIPQPPTNFTATAISEKEISLNWNDNSDNEEGFEIYRDGKLIYKTKVNETSYIDSDLSPNILYKYSIKAVNSAGASIQNSTEAKTFGIDKEVPNSPSNFTAIAISDKVVELKWSDGSDNERGYKIYRDGKLIATIDYKHTFYTDENLVPDTLYEYKISSFNSKGESKSLKAQVKTKSKPTSKPNPPSDFTAIANGDKIIELRWKDNSDNEESFNIYRDGKLIYTTVPNQSIYIDYNLNSNTLYKYEIKAVNEIGESDSVSAEAKTLDRASILIPPTNLFAEVKNDKEIVLTWSDNSDNEEGFKIFKNNELIYTTKVNTTTYTDKDVKINEIYTYVVKATNKNGDSIGDSVKAQISAHNQNIPASPSKFKAESKGVLNVELSWIDNDKDDKKYKIYRNDKLIYTADVNESSYVDTTVEPDIEYIYSIVAFNENGDTDPVEAKIKLTINQIQKFVYNLYKKILERKPDDEGLLYWENELKTKNKTALYVVKQFIKLPEFSSKNIDSEKYVKILYKTFFNRVPESSGLNYWKDMLDKSSYPRDILFYKFAFSNEFKSICEKYGINNYTDKEKVELFIERLYQLILKRPSDRESLEYWSSLILDKIETPKNIAKSFFDSDEFKKKRISNEEIITIAYRALLDREPDKDGINYWKEKLETGMKLDKMLDVFLNSEEFSTLVKKGFVNEL